MLTTHAAGSATAPPIASCSFVFRVVGIIDDLKKKAMESSQAAATAYTGYNGCLIIIVQTYQMDGEVTSALACISRFLSLLTWSRVKIS